MHEEEIPIQTLLPHVILFGAGSKKKIIQYANDPLYEMLDIYIYIPLGVDKLRSQILR